MRIERGANMRDARRWVAAAVWLLCSVAAASGAHHRRSMINPTTLPVSKGGWRPVISSGLNGYAQFGAAPLLAPAYKIPVPVLDNYQQASSRPIPAREPTKLTSIAQSYRPTTLRSLPATSPSQSANQPINTYYNPFTGPNNGHSHYKFVQNYPMDNVVIRNPHNPYAARPVYSKYPTKFKQPPLQNVQQLQYLSYQQNRPNDVFGKPVEAYARPLEAPKRPQSNTMEIYKPEVYKLPDSDTAPQQVSQQVKTAQQQNGNVKAQLNGYPPFQFKDEKYAPIPPGLLGTFNSFGVQSVVGRDPVYQPAKTTYVPAQPTKQTIFNSFSYTPHYKTTPNYFLNTTPRQPAAINQVNYETTHTEAKLNPTQATSPNKVDPNAGAKVYFKPSPQDPFSKYPKADGNKIPASTYKPQLLQTTQSVFNYYNSNFKLPSQYQHSVQTSYFNPPSFQFDKKHKIHDTAAAPASQQTSAPPPPSLPHKKPAPPVEPEPATQDSLPRPATYEVTENSEEETAAVTHAAHSWTSAPDDRYYKRRPATEDSVTSEESYTRPAPHDLPEEYAIVTEADNVNALNYDLDDARRPADEDFQPINKQKLKEYYYKVSTPVYEEYTTVQRRKPKPTEEPTQSAPVEQEVSTTAVAHHDELSVKPLPTLPPSLHFKRPSSGETVDKDKIRKRIKNRRRRPPLANLNRDKQESSTQKYVSTTTASEVEEKSTVRPRVRIPRPRPHLNNLTTPTVTTDLSTSGIPTTSPTAPTVARKKILRRPHTTTTERFETTTLSYRDNELNKESAIMKIATRQQHPRVTTVTFDYKPTEPTDYSHKQDEKDTPTSDISLGITESLRYRPDTTKQFSFHTDYKPIEAILEPIQTTTDIYRKDNTEEASEITTFAPRSESTDGGKTVSRLKNKYDRPKFSVKDYRSRLSSTTSTEKPQEVSAPKIRFPQRRLPFDRYNSDNDSTTTERRRYVPKDSRNKVNNDNETDTSSVRTTARQRQTTIMAGENTETVTQKISSRIRSSSRRPKPTEDTTETSSPTTVHVKRPQRKKVKDSETGESVQDVTVTETTANYPRDDSTSERTKSESAIMKIAKDDKKHLADPLDLYEHSKRVSDLTLAASKDYNKPGMFKTVSPTSRRIPSYFTIATDDPILPIEAFFPQLNKKET